MKIVTRGFLAGIKDVVLRGFGLGSLVVTPDAYHSSLGFIDDCPVVLSGVITYQDVSIGGMIYNNAQIIGLMSDSENRGGAMDGNAISVDGEMQ